MIIPFRVISGFSANLLTNTLLLRKLIAMNATPFPLHDKMMMSMLMDMSGRVWAAKGMC